MNKVSTRLDEIERRVNVDDGPPLPCVLMQDPDGTVRVAGSNDPFPLTPEVLARYARQGLRPIVIREMTEGEMNERRAAQRRDPGIA